MTTTTPPDLNIGPLTTTFTAPSACAKIGILPVYYGSQTSSIYYLSAVVYKEPSCYPSSKPLGAAYTLSTLALYDNHDEHIFYSPGICPSGWASSHVAVTYSTVTSTITGVVVVTAIETDTKAFCCPPGFTASTQTFISDSSFETFWRCDSSITMATTVVSGTVTAVFGITSLRADAVFIKYRAGDFGLTLTSVSSGSSPTSTTNQTSIRNATNSIFQPSAATPASNGGLSAGAKTGLGVGVPLVVIFIGVIFAWIFMRRRGQRSSDNTAQAQIGENHPHYIPGYKAELDATSIKKAMVVNVTAPTAELEAVPKYNIPISRKKFTVPIVKSNSTQQKQENTGPLIKPPEFESSPLPVRSAEDEELEYQERRLRERREMLTERENITREEEELRIQRMSKP